MANQINGLLSPFLRKQRIQTAVPYIKGDVLDFGCGTGQLSEFCNKGRYFGIDIDVESILIAKEKYPAKVFMHTNEISQIKIKFHSIAALAVIEHMENPANFLIDLKQLLTENGRIIITTPHPGIRTIHEIGGKIGLFSREGSKEHKDLLDYHKMELLAQSAFLKIEFFKRFLFGANQLFILKPIV